MMAGCPWFSTGQKPCGAWPRKYATAISPATMKATGRVNSPSSRNRPPNVSRVPAMPGSDAIGAVPPPGMMAAGNARSEEHTSELQSRGHLVCRLLLEKKKHRPRQALHRHDRAHRHRAREHHTTHVAA